MLTKLWQFIHKQDVKDLLGKYAYRRLEDLGILDKHAKYFVDGFTCGRPYTITIKVREKNSTDHKTQKVKIRYDDENFIGKPIPVMVSHSSVKIHQLMQPYGEHRECLSENHEGFDGRNFHPFSLEIVGDLENFTPGIEEFTDYIRREDFASFFEQFVQDFLPMPWD